MRLKKMYNILVLLTVISAMVSCAAPTKTVVMPTTERIINNDSVIIYQRDSIIEKWLHDTVTIEKHYTKNLYKVKVDTVYVEKPIEVQVPVNITPEWALWSLLANILILAIIIIYVAIKITKTIYLRR